ncbi:unnamed protein product [Merluccius merluccius]
MMTSRACTTNPLHKSNLFPPVKDDRFDHHPNQIRRTLFFAVETAILHDKLADEVPPTDRATFQFLRYQTCKGEFLQVTLENPDFCSMSPPIREDVTQGRLFLTFQRKDTGHMENLKMDHIAAVCLYRQNLIQSATMMAEFSVRFDNARNACVAALYASHIVCTGVTSRKVSFCINQLVYAEAMKLACHFVFDIWIPPWTNISDEKEYLDLRGNMKQMNKNRLKALNKLSFGQICLETNAVYKLCSGAFLPGHMSPGGRHTGSLCLQEVKGGNDVAHEMLMLCSTCKVPACVDFNAFGQCSNDKICPTLDFNKDPVLSVILEATAGIEPLNELTFNKCVLGGKTFQCSAPFRLLKAFLHQLCSPANIVDDFVRCCELQSLP